MSEIKSGDIVYLKSGSPPMTVYKIEGEASAPIVEVEWFKGVDCVRDAFAMHSLAKEPFKSDDGLSKPIIVV
jgi:uncharacterized protein YodC (DUF2158 family)